MVTRKRWLLGRIRPPPPKVKPPRKTKTALRKRTRKTADNGADGKTAKQPSLDVILKQLTRLKSDGTDLRCLASLLSEEPPAGDSTN